MKTESKTVAVPARGEWEDLLESERNERRAQFGRAAVYVGTPDRGQNDDRTDAIDTIANVLHFFREHDPDFSAEVLVGSAVFHYLEEREQ